MKKFPIDLSCLTEEEISQFQEDPYTLYNGDQEVALYLRYSSTGQSDQSIEGQLRDCRAFCKANHYRIVAIYVDRATTARKDVEKRVHLMEMVADSAKQNWEYVIVWKLDRFARNRNDSAIMKMRLRKNGVKVLSATEHLTDSPESIILESVLEGMAEFFSAELSQKVTRGMRESALKCHSVGGHIPLGYKVENHKLVVDPDTAHIVQEAFSLYANGESVADICRKFNSAGYKTAKNTEFNRSSFKAMFRNTRYIGTYTYKDIVIENGIPAIIDKELFETVQRRLSKTATAPARGKAKVDYLLSGKLFCGHCGASMNGESGAGRHGKVYHYYSCYTKKRKLGCDKRPLKKDYIEGIVARDALNLLTDQLIDEIADMAIRQSEQDLINDTHIPQLTAQLSEVEKSITNITAAIEKGIASETLMNRLVQLEYEKKTLNKEIKAEEKFVYRIDRDQIVFWLSQFKYGNIEDEDFRRRLIDLLVNSVTVWDEPDGYKITTAYNLTSCKTKTFRVEKNPAAEEATGFDFGESECAIGETLRGSLTSSRRQVRFQVSLCAASGGVTGRVNSAVKSSPSLCVMNSPPSSFKIAAQVRRPMWLLSTRASSRRARLAKQTCSRSPSRSARMVRRAAGSAYFSMFDRRLSVTRLSICASVVTVQGVPSSRRLTSKPRLRSSSAHSPSSCAQRICASYGSGCVSCSPRLKTRKYRNISPVRSLS